MRRLTGISLIGGLVLVSYGYLYCTLNIYFFLDSKVIGWFILFFALVGLLFSLPPVLVSQVSLLRERKYCNTKISPASPGK